MAATVVPAIAVGLKKPTQYSHDDFSCCYTIH